MAPAKKTTSKTNIEKAKRARAAELEAREGAKRKLWSIVIFIIGFLLIVFSISGLFEAEEKNAAGYISDALYGVFGLSVFFVGPVLIYIAYIISKNKNRQSIASRITLFTFIILLVSAALQIIFVGPVEFSELYENGRNLNGGGVIGGLLGWLLMQFGKPVAITLVILIGFVMFMLASSITLHEFLKFISTPFRKIGTEIKQKSDQMREDSEYLRELNDEKQRLEAISQVAAQNEEPDLKQIKDKGIDIEKRLKFASIEAAANSVRNIGEPVLMTDESVNLLDELNAYNRDEDIIIEEPDNPILDALEDFKQEEAELLAESEKNEQTLKFNEKNGADIVQAADARENQVNDFKEPQYLLPPVTLLNEPAAVQSTLDIESELEQNSVTLVETLKSFGVQTKIVGVCRGPSVTRYELQPAAGVKISKITGLIDDITLNLATAGVRIEAPIPNKPAVGIEVPNRTTDTVHVRSLIDSEVYRKGDSKLSAVIGMDISGEIITCDIAKMPHILIAGTTGSGKSVCVNSIIMSILFRSTPEDVRFVMIDPKAVEFMIYNGIPHLLIPVVTDPKKAAGALSWAVAEMLNRYKAFSDNNVRDLFGYNSLCTGNDELVRMPQIVIFIDELADLMMVAPGDVESGICRLAQMGRAAGIHLVIATQRPSVDVITGIIKANIPSRIALKVASQVDSRTIIDSAGAEKLLGKGDMLFFPVGAPKPMRVQGCWVSEKEVERTADFIKKSFVLDYDESVIEEIEKNAEFVGASKAEKEKAVAGGGDSDNSDDKLDEAIEAVIEAGQASTSYLQRRLKLGYGRAARLIDIMEQMGVVGTFEGSKPRQVIMTKAEWYEMKMNKDT